MTLEKVDCFGLPSDWIPLHYYQGVPYVFSSCMVDVPQQRRLTDSLLIHRDMEIFFFPLAGSERVSPTVCHFKLAVESNVADSPVSGFTDVYIHQVDERTKATVWEYRKPGQETSYALMVPVESARYFRLMVCDSWFHEISESIDFDKVDAKALLESAKAGKEVNLYHLNNDLLHKEEKQT